MALPPSLLLAFAILPLLSSAKFQNTYEGLAASGVQTCIATSDFTSQNITLRRNCGEAFACIMANIPNQHQSILSSGSAILGFVSVRFLRMARGLPTDRQVPTVLLVLGSPNEDIMRISARFPLLALLLSITSISKRPRTGQGQHFGTTKVAGVQLGPYGVVGTTDNKASPINVTVGFIAAHIIAALGAVFVTWQTVDLGRKAVVTWACWTDFYPVIWLVIAVLHHNLSVVCLRVSLRVRIRSRDREPEIVCNALSVWDVTSVDGNVECSRKRLARWSKAALELLNNANYLYGTAIYSSLTMVSGHQAIKVLVLYGAVAVFPRVAAIWVLEEMGGSREP